MHGSVSAISGSAQAHVWWAGWWSDAAAGQVARHRHNRWTEAAADWQTQSG